MVFRMAAVIIAALISMAATCADAQYWMTKEACDVTTPKVDKSLADFDLVAKRAAEIINGTGRLWRITSPDGAVSHLWGTFHSNDPLILDLPDELREVLAMANTVAPELDARFTSRRRLENIIQGRDLFRNFRSKGDLPEMDPRIGPWIKSRMISLGYSSKAAEHIKAEAVAEILLLDPCNDFSYGVLPIQDDRIMLLGLDAGADIIGLEDKSDYRRELSKPDKVETLNAIIELYGFFLNPEEFHESRNTSFALYLQGRVGEMMALENIKMEQFFGSEKAERISRLADGYLLVERNRNFVAVAEPLLDKGGALIAAGCFHLPGETGLIAMFRMRGFQVERVFVDGEAET
ncbi:MAG: TraB/GumN family protein [Rhodobacteraceae bacterium]|nr:TraB/GumN family protein [Paracoccaceae bacterium]